MSKKKISIVGGLGHVGLPLAFMLASKRFDVTIIYIDKKKIYKIKKKSYPLRKKVFYDL